MSVIIRVYRILKQLGITKTHSTFSQDFLGRRCRYMDDLICAKRSVSVPATIACLMRINDILCAHESSGRDTMIIRKLEEAAKLLWTDLECRNKLTLPRLRPGMRPLMPRQRYEIIEEK
jgi:hypothetical protein